MSVVGMVVGAEVGWVVGAVVGLVVGAVVGLVVGAAVLEVVGSCALRQPAKRPKVRTHTTAMAKIFFIVLPPVVLENPCRLLESGRWVSCLVFPIALFLRS